MNETKVLSAWTENNYSVYALAGLKKVFMPTMAERITATKIVEATCEYFKVPLATLCMRTRKRTSVYPRECASYLIEQNTKLTLKQIAAHFGDAVLDHTSIMHYLKTIKNQMEVDSSVRGDIESIYEIANYIPTISSSQTIKSIQAI